MMTLTKARQEIADEIGPDVASFTPPDEKHFFGAALMAAAGGWFLFAFLKGVVTKLGDRSGAYVGEKLADFLADKVREVREHDPGAQDGLLQSALAEAQTALRASQLETAKAQALSSELEQRLAAALAQDAPDDVSARVARRVRAVGAELLR